MIRLDVDLIPIISAIFSLLSIVLTALTIITQKLVMKHQSIMMVTFDMRHKGMTRGLELRVRDVVKALAAILEVHSGSIEIEQGTYLNGGGFHMSVRVDIDDDS